ncbi:MAG TPA: tRNA-dihydrouridine synthase [Phycisphaerales bacterium]|nr:tRNA-dihydrouridine synthase [Phycisphaerales bacterium]
MTVTLKPFRIGDIEVRLPVVLAALAGYSDLPYRLLCRRMGAPFATTEMMLDRYVLLAGKYRKIMAATTDEDHPVVGQIIGNEPDVMASAAVELCRMGFDAVDLNFACPVNKALRRRRGGFLMSQPRLALDITRAVLSAVDRPVVLKLRRNFRRADDDTDFWQIAEGALDAGAAALTVHARSVEQKYAGPADWQFLADVKRRFGDRTILGSGDVHDARSALEMLERTGVDAATAARGALGNPWLFRQVIELAAGQEPRAPTLAEQREVMRAHFDAAVEFYGPLKGPKVMRGFGIRYARLHPTPKKIRVAFVEVKRPDDWQRVLEEFYSPQ